MFDEKWNNAIYAQNKQINKYPYNWVVSKVYAYFKGHKLINKEAVLELGSGTGNNLSFLSEFGFEKIIGVEGSLVATKLARNFLKKKKNVSLKNFDFINLPMKDNKFILCLDRGSITHNGINDIKKTFKEVYRVLKPGGYFFSSLFSNKHYQYLKSKKYKNKTLSFEDIMGVNGGIVASFFDEKEIRRLFSKFEILEIIHEVNTWHHDKKKSTAMWNIIAKKK
tara:strand:+ start:179 stop:847 length:669 start_codon:yes stop_codon:yes gene_type:complete